MISIKKMEDDFRFFWDKIVKGENFSFLRYADGERALINGESVNAQEGWKAPERITKVGRQLDTALSLNDEDVYYAISCPCCDPEAYLWYLDKVKTNNLTFANLWINANHGMFVEHFEKLNRDAVVIANYRAEGKKIGNLNIIKQYSISDDCVGFWEKEGDEFLNRIINETANMKNTLFVVSAGPLSEIIIYNLYLNNPENSYVDFGSSLDIYIHGNITRPYMRADSREANQHCWMLEEPRKEMDVDVVLTAYKRPECLKLQIEAILNQSLKPKNLYLFQDGIDSYYKIELNEEIKKYFKKIEISENNCGVWQRFEFASQVSDAKYICIFDDDTIPGSRWLENCFFEMQKNEGIYGTNGIVLSEEYTYPMGKKDIRIGWHNSNDSTVEVDFVGHSWFLKKEWLTYMFEVGKGIRENYKYVGEDMCLSYGAAIHGIKTFVPPHPISVPELWGSLSKYGNKFGAAGNAVSGNSFGYTMMNEALMLLKKAGWKNICERDYEYFTEISSKYNEKKLEYIGKLIADLIKICESQKSIYIYGAGKYAGIIYTYLNINKINIQGFVVTKDNGEKDVYNGLPVISASAFRKLKNEKFLILGLSEFYHEEIRSSFKKDNIKVYPIENDGNYEKLVENMNLYI